jgi:hypothetical protein
MSIRNGINWFVMGLVMAAFAFVPAVAQAKPQMHKLCKSCHSPSEDRLFGRSTGMSEKFKTMQVDVGVLTWVVKFDDKTKLNGAKSLGAIPKGREVQVVFKGSAQNPVATEVFVKPPYKIAKDMIVSVEDMKDLVRKGPKKGKYTLVDARPGKAFIGGHLPWAKNLPYPAFDKKYASVLPKDKSSLIIFYCGGFT